MGLHIGGLVVAMGLLGHAIYLRIGYFKHEALCLEHSLYGKYFMTFPLYEYELVEEGKRVTYKRRGRTYFYPKKGKSYKVLISKKDHNKVVGYMRFVVHLLEGVVLSTAIIAVLVLFH